MACFGSFSFSANMGGGGGQNCFHGKSGESLPGSSKLSPQSGFDLSFVGLGVVSPHLPVCKKFLLSLLTLMPPF